MIPKHKPIINNKLIEDMREEIPSCEICGGFSFGAFTLEMCHVIAKGMGGGRRLDIRENLFKACGPAALWLGCHGQPHKGKISKEKIWVAIAKRENITVEECKARVQAKRKAP
jgi:hypothetical protein